MSGTKKYWRGIEELREDEGFVASKEEEFNSYQKPTEFVGEEGVEDFNTNRRDFLKYLGFGVTAATLAACEAPVQKAIPYVIKPEEVEPGLANWYASSFYDGVDFANILVKTREGRPIHLTANKESKVLQTGVNSRINTSVLGLYDSKRAVGFMRNTQSGYEPLSHGELDKEVISKLSEISAKDGNIVLLTNTIISPSTFSVIEKFKTKYGNVNHVMYDSISKSGALNANKVSFGKRVLPMYDFSKAKVIVSIADDFLQNGSNGLNQEAGYTLRRNPDGHWMSKHFQFEANMSLTGSNADLRTIATPVELNAVVANLYVKVTGDTSVKAPDLAGKLGARVANAAEALLANRGESLVLGGSNDENVQLLINGINKALGNVGSTLNFNKAVNLRKADDQTVLNLIKDMQAGKVDALLINGVNPVYSLPSSLGFAEAMEKVSLKVSFADKATEETAKLADYLAPDNHYLESWNDLNPVEGEFSFQQPTIQPLFETRQFQSTLLAWAGENHDYYDFLRSNWSTKLGLEDLALVNTFNKLIHDGVYSSSSTSAMDVISNDGEMSSSDEMTANYASAAKKLKYTTDKWQVEFYSSTAMGDGRYIANPYLQELPDPLTKVTWDNYIAMSPVQMEELGFNTMLGQKQMSNLAAVTVNGQTVELPVVALPGLPKKFVAIALGYGRECGYQESMIIGKSVSPLMGVDNGTIGSYSFEADLVGIEGEYNIASTQTHHTMMGRKIVNEVNLDTYKNEAHDNPVNGWNKPVEILDSYGEAKSTEELDLWAEHGIDLGHRWGLSIDLNKCTGCSACVSACHIENNVPVVGKDEVNRARDMHWLRIDRYFTTEEENQKKGTAEQYSYDYAALEIPEEEPQVVHQPVMCQHCNHAPCETVCPVAATTHSDEGLNQMAYNRCFGTRYCANNCPYKVRRFNWFNFTAYKKFSNFNPAQDDLGRMVLNPDVVVRTRGVMEKCSMCVQRIQEVKLDAKKSGKPIKDSALNTACSDACGAGAITFGDVNDKSSEVRAGKDHKRAYNLLEEVGVQPNVWYQTKVRNTEKA